MKLKIAYFILFSFSIRLWAQLPQQNAAFEKLKTEIVEKYYDVDALENTLASAEKLIKLAKNDYEKGVALYVKANVLINASSDINSGELALPFALESTKILAGLKSDSLYIQSLSAVSNSYIKKYSSKKHDVSPSNAAVYFSNISVMVNLKPGYRPKETYLPIHNDREASVEILKTNISMVKKYLNEFVKPDDFRQKMYKYQAIGRLSWYVSHNYDECEKYLLIALKNADLCKDSDFKYVILNTFCSLAIESKNFEKAKYYGTLNLRDVLKTKNETREGIILNMLYDAKKNLGEYEEAYKHKERAIEITDKYHRENEKNRLKLLKERNKTLESQFQLQNELEKQRNIRLIMGLIIAALAIGFGGLIYYNRSLIIKNKAINAAMLQGQTIERKRVAMDLHDNLGSTLSALWLSLDTIDQSSMNKNEKEIHKNLRENLEKAYNEELEKKGLAGALEAFVRNINKNTKISFTLNIAKEVGRLDNTIEFELYSICLELATNIIKHSKAKQAEISITKKDAKSIVLTIADNGIGMANIDTNGKGLLNVEARVETLNGTWLVNKKEQQGIKNEIIIPIS
jgi:signal transduction histidine kinase